MFNNDAYVGCVYCCYAGGHCDAVEPIGLYCGMEGLNAYGVSMWCGA